MSIFSYFVSRAELNLAKEMAEHLRFTATSVLRAFGSHGFDLPEQTVEELDKQTNTLARRLEARLVDEPTIEPEALAEFIKKRRKAETAYVLEAIPALQATVYEVVRGFTETVSHGERDDETLQSAVNGLAKALTAGDPDDVRFAASSALDVVRANLVRRIDRNQAQLDQMGQKLKEMRARVAEAEAKSTEDELTRLPNRAALDQRLEQEVMVAELTGDPMTVLMIDVDHFKNFNDTHGHAAGDRVLAAVGDTMVRCFPRKSDFAARYGGEEFSVVLSNVPLDRAIALAERFRAAMEKLVVPYEEKELRVTCSVGAAQLMPKEAGSQVIQRADAALYAAKKGGRNRVQADWGGVDNAGQNALVL